jgi:hypothetical protein
LYVNEGIEWIRDSQDPDGVARSGSSAPAADADDGVAGSDESGLLAEVDAEVEPLVDVLRPVGFLFA